MTNIHPSARQKLVLAAFDQLPYKDYELVPWFYEGADSKINRNSFRRKLRGERHFSPAESTLMQALLTLHRLGYDLASVKFSENGEIESIRPAPVSLSSFMKNQHRK